MSGETDQNGAFVGEINFDVANLFIVHRAIPIILHDTEDMDPLKEDNY
jgi:hypothetical protein